MTHVCAEMALLIYLKHLSCLWKLETQRLSSACRVKFNIVYNWMREVLNELFSCLLLLRESKQQFCPILLTVVSAVWLLLKWERIAHHPYHFKNLSWLLEMFIISLAKESNLSTLENYWSVNNCLLNPRYVFRIPAQFTEWAIKHNGSFFPYWGRRDIGE